MYTVPVVYWSFEQRPQNHVALIFHAHSKHAENLRYLTTVPVVSGAVGDTERLVVLRVDLELVPAHLLLIPLLIKHTRYPINLIYYINLFNLLPVH